MPRMAATFYCLLASLAAAGPARADDDAVDIGTTIPDVDKIRQGLFPDDECHQLAAAGFKCMGFKPPVRFSLPAVSFKLGSAELPDLLKHQLDQFAVALASRKEADEKVRVEGHADASGDALVNDELSRRRAENAREYLIRQGVDAGLLVAVGVGSRHLMDPANPEAATNRRVVIRRDQASPDSARDHEP
jgi:outer membrane protein OmpA-like peptidoglycan-associated protein